MLPVLIKDTNPREEEKELKILSEWGMSPETSSQGCRKNFYVDIDEKSSS
jgi:hypothetical protein